MKKVVNTDIYNVVDLVNDVKKLYMPNEPDSALSVGLYGYIGAIEAKRLQTQIMMTSELANEPFPSRARLDRNVITHAIMANIEDINAIPAKMNAVLSLKESDIANFFDANDEFIVDRDIPIYLGEYEFHLDYDIIVKKIYLNNGGDKAATYTARYDISRKNPTSDISNPFLSTPFVVNIDNQSYLNITIVVSQVMHNKVYKKLVTPNIVDNKTLTFEFDNQLAYFEIHTKELDSEYWVTPIFEGSSVPNGVQYYCWYQYIDTNLIRVRFDRSSYIPGLNAEVEILYKTTFGEDGNFSYNKKEYIDLHSKRYGYKGLIGLFSALTPSKNGRNRKSKNELKALIPKELLSRGSYTTISDLNNYFGMFDSTYGRMIIQKKIDNQQERVYYSYAVLKDQSLNVIPSNTIDLKIDKKFLIKSSLNDSQAPRFILKSGSVIKMDKNNVGYVTDEPLVQTGVVVNTVPIQKGKKIIYNFKIKVVDNSYKDMSISANLENGSNACSRIIYLPDDNVDLPHYIDRTENSNVLLTDKTLIGPGELFGINFSFTGNDNGSRWFKWKDAEWFEIISIEKQKDGKVIKTDPSELFTHTKSGSDYYSGIEFKNLINGSKYSVMIIIRATVGLKLENNLFEFSNNLDNINIMNVFDGTNVNGFFNVDGFILEQKTPITGKLNNGDLINFEASFKSIGNNIAPNIVVKLSKGLEFSKYNESLSYEGGETHTELELVTKNLEESNGFVYTNPFTISINKHILYSAFYMMCINENPFIHFEYINQASSVQFISTNILWYRNFLGADKDKYHLEITLTQSTQDDLGLLPPMPNHDNKLPIVKAVAVFYRDGNPYRYKIMDMTSYDTGKYSYTFKASFNSIDTLDNDNNIRVEGAEVIGQKETESTATQYGYFNPNTELKIYALCAKPDNAGNYSRYDLDQICPGLDLTEDGNRWTLTNIYSVVNGITMYYNYSEIMGSKVIAYGDTTVNNKTTIIDESKDGGYLVKSVPVFGYEYCQNDIYIKNAIDTLNSRKIYIDHSLELLENSFNVDLKFFNTYGKSNIYYVIKDTNSNNILDDKKEILDKVNLTLHFRLKLLSSNDNYTKDSIIKDIKEYIEDLADIGNLHIPNLITSITTAYKERIVYFEYLGLNEYGPEVQHIYKLEDNEIPIDKAPEFLNVNNIKNNFNQIIPDINIYISEN